MVKQFAKKLAEIYIKNRRMSASDAIIIAGSARSGTTWVAELFNEIPGVATIFEPLNTEYVKDSRAQRILERTFIKPGDTFPEAEEFFRECLEGRIVEPWTLSSTSLKRLLFAKKIAVKFIRANMLLRWLIDTFQIEKSILILRHPCAVIASQLKGNYWSTLPPPNIPSLFREYPQFKEMVYRAKTQEEILALHWAFETVVPLATPAPHPWILISYEQLVLNSEAEIKKILSRLSLPSPLNLDEIIERPSSRTWKDERQKKKKPIERLSAWKKKLSERQEKLILDMVHELGLDFYSSAVEPDYQRLNAIESFGLEKH